MTPTHPFPWRRGMRATLTLPDRVVEFVVLNAVVCADGVVRLVILTDTDSDPTWLDCDDDCYPRADACTPVDCGATRGELLDAVRELYNDPKAYVMFSRSIGAWVFSSFGRDPIESYVSAFAALLAAYNAAPRSTP